MIRNLKTLGVALAAVLALGAVVASGASAAQAYLTGDGPLKDLTGKDIGAATANRLTALGTFTKCTNSTYTVTKENGEPFEHETTLKAVPSYTGCTSTILGVETHVAMNGCYYVFHLKETTGTPADTYGVLATLVCTGANKPEVLITQPGDDCLMTITPNAAGYSGLDILDNTNGEVTLKGTATGIKADATAPCPTIGEVTEEITASLDAEVTITGDNSLNEPTAIGISELGESTSTP